MKLIRLSCFLLLLPFVTQAQTKLSSGDNSQTYTLQECIDYAIQHNISLQQSRLTVERSLNTLDQSRANILPKVNGQYNFNANFGRNIDPFSNDVVTSTIGTNQLGVGANMTLYNGFRQQNTIASNQLSLTAAQQDLDALKNSIALQVSLAYLNVLSAQDRIIVAEKTLESTKLQYDRTERLVKSGSLAETNMFNIEAQIANDELQLLNAQNALESANLTLKQSMNITDYRPIEVSRMNVPSPDLTPYPQNPEEVYEKAISYLPEVKAAKTRELIADKGIEIANAVGLPTLNANASWGSAYSTAAKNVTPGQTTYQPLAVSAEFQGETIPFVINFPQQTFDRENIPYFNQIGKNQNVNLGVSLGIPIFNGYNKKYQTQGAKIQKMQAELTTDNTLLTIRQNIDQAYINMTNAGKSYSASTVQVNALQRALEAATASYNAGASNFTDYNVAKANLDRAQASQIQAKYEYLFRIKVLDFYQNKPLGF